MEFVDVEREALKLPPAESITLSVMDVEILLGNVEYHPSLGEPASARHYRRSLTDGSCMHLVVDGEHAALHRDLHDPHGGPALLAFHLMSESRRQAGSLLIATVALLRRVVS